MKKYEKAKALRWLGQAWIGGIPARDLSAEEAERYGYEQLIESGLYEPIETIKEELCQE